ncbi:MAG: hypothetical protein WBS24_13530 [Terriglobales bacterium]
MSVSGILSSSQYQPQHQLTNSQFQQLGSDLASGNLSSAQSDFATLQAAFAATGTTSSPSSASSTTSSNPLAAAFQQLSNDLQSGNITGAQRDYSTIKNDMQNQFSGHSHVGHHHGTGEDSILPISNPASQDTLFPQAQSAAQVAQQTYSPLEQQLQQLQGYTLASGTSAAGIAALLNPISLMA